MELPRGLKYILLFSVGPHSPTVHLATDGVYHKVAAFALGPENRLNVPLSRMDPRCTRPKILSEDISEEATHVRGTHPPIIANLLFPGPLFLSENPKGFRQNTHHYISRTT